jgi:alcohol dehydrogenase, propanol-preferring
MILEEQHKPLVLREVAKPQPQRGQVLIKVHTCGVCRTDLHIVDGDLTEPKLPLILGHQIVGTVEKLGEGVNSINVGQKVGVPWLNHSCQHCGFCCSGRENLCDDSTYTGYQVDGGYAEYCVANEHFCLPIPHEYSDIQAAPLLCAGLIGYRAYRMTSDATRIGFYGFGASAHILLQLARFEGKEVYAFTRQGDENAQLLAKKLGATWVGHSGEAPPEKFDAAIIFAPVGGLVPEALSHLQKGGRVVCAGIHMSDIPSFPYSLLWGERSVCSVANLTRRDGIEFLALAPKIPIVSEVTTYDLEEANRALSDLRDGKITGSAVITL